MSWRDIIEVTTYKDQIRSEMKGGDLAKGGVFVIDHFSRPLKIRKYTNPNGLDISDGFNKIGEFIEESFWCVIKSRRAGINGTMTVNDSSGVRESSSWWLYYNPYHRMHNQETGQHLQTSVRSNNTSYVGFPDVVEYQDELYSVDSVKKIDVGYFDDEVISGEDHEGIQRYIGKCGISSIGNINHMIGSNSCTVKTVKGKYILDD